MMTFTDFFGFNIGSNHSKPVGEEKIKIAGFFCILDIKLKYLEVLVVSLLLGVQLILSHLVDMITLSQSKPEYLSCLACKKKK